MGWQDGAAPNSQDTHGGHNDVDHGTVGDVLPGSLLGPVMGLAFSNDGSLLFACSGSSISIYHVHSGALLSTVRIFTPGLAVYGLDVGRATLGVVFGDRCTRIVDGVPTGASTTSCQAPPAAPAPTPAAAPASAAPPSAAAPPPPPPPPGAAARGESCQLSDTVENNAGPCASSTEEDGGNSSGKGGAVNRRLWFRNVASLSDLDDRVWDARLIADAVEGDGDGTCPLTEVPIPRLRTEGGEEGGRARGKRAGMGMVALALAHNSVEVWDWASQRRPFRVYRARGGGPCLLYHASLWGRTLAELRVAAGTVFNQVLLWTPRQADARNAKMTSAKSDTTDPGDEGEMARSLGTCDVMRLQGHEGVIFRVSWRKDGKRLASASDDRTVRVWDVEHCDAHDGTAFKPANRLVWTGWGHVSRVWDVGFTSVGVVTCGEDGTAILWREGLARENAASPGTAAGLKTPAATAAPKVSGGHGRQLVPAAIMRGHSGAHVWRLAVHEFGPCSIDHDGSDICGTPTGGGGIAERGPVRGLVLMATGGNDGAAKLWDLEFEAACESANGRESREGTHWGETETLPTTVCQNTAGRAASPTCKTDSTVGTKTSKGMTLPVISTTSLSGGGDKVGHQTIVEMETQSFAVEKNDTTSWPCGPPQDRTGEGKRLGRGQGRAARRQDDRHRLKPTIVREVRLSRDGTGAALLLADGSVWWVDDLDIGVWQPVTVLEPNTTSPAPRPRDSQTEAYMDSRPDSDGTPLEIMREASSLPTGRAEAAAGATVEGLLSSRGVSAIAVVRIRPKGEADGDNVGRDSAGACAGKDISGRGTETRHKNVCRGRDGVSIVVGRDDGRLFLLTRRRPTMAVSPDKCCPDEATSERFSGKGHNHTAPLYPWCVSASWKGPEVRVTAMWTVGEGAKSTPSQGGTPERGSCHFTSALETSILRYPSGACDGARIDGALVSAGANGTVAWWEWPSAANIRGVASDVCDKGAERGENTGIRAPNLRLVCQADPGARVSSIVIDDRTCVSRADLENPNSTHASADPGGGEDADSSPRAFVFGGDTKGNLYCFLEQLTSPAASGENMDIGSEPRGRGDRGGDDRLSIMKGVKPCFILKRQHGKDQISRIALRGDCLLSAGHDGHVNHYKISYPSLGEPHATAGQRHPTGKDAHVLGCPASAKPHFAAGDWSVRAEGRRKDAGAPGRKGGGSSLKGFGHFLPSSTTPPVMLTLVTCYATSPITAVSDLWVGGGRESSGENMGTEEEARSSWATETGKLRIAVAGRSGSSRMSVWDLTQARQLLELECGDRHLAHDLLLSWPPTARATSSTPTSTAQFHEQVFPAITAQHGSISALCTDGGGGDCPATPLRLSLPSASCGVTPTTPQHAFVFARLVSRARAVGGDRSRGTGSLCVEKNETPWPREEQPGSFTEQQRPGMTLAYHSSAPWGEPTSGKWTWPRQEVPLLPLHGASQAPKKKHSAQKIPTERKAEGLRELQEYGTRPLERSSACERWTTSSEVPAFLPTRFAYSLGAPFHGQRVVSARFIPGDAAMKTPGGSLANLRLVTGGEDGVVKLLDVFYKGQCTGDEIAIPGRPAAGGDSAAHNRTEPDICEPRDTFHYPYARVTQTLPSHESSVGALAVGFRAENSCTSSGVQGVVISGGGKMELRAWCLEDQLGIETDVGRGKAAAVDATCTPPMRWLMTTTPDPKSWLHAHRIMSLCVLPPPLSWPATVVASAFTKPQDTLVVAGDSGGGVAVFNVRHANGDVASDTARETRSQSAGRWMASGKRPVLCLAHVRVALSEGFPSPQSPVCSKQTKSAAGRGDLNRGPAGDFVDQVFTSDDEGVEAVVNRCHRRGAESAGCDEGGPQGRPEHLYAQENSFVSDKRRRDPPFAMARQDRDDVDGAGRKAAAEVADLIASGDTGGTVTLWQLLPGVGSAVPSDEDPPRSSKVGEGFVHRGPSGRRRGGVHAGGETAAETPRLPSLLPVLEYRAHQMGVLCIAIHALPESGHFLIVTGGDDQAICVAEVEVLRAQPKKASDGGLAEGEGQDNGGQSDKTTARSRRLNVRVIGGGPERTDAAAGSAIKGISVLPTVLKRKSLPETISTKPETGSAAGSITAGSDRPPMMLTLFTVSRDQRLSRWDIVEDASLTLASPNFKGAAGQYRTPDGGAGGVRVCSAQVERGARRSNTSSCGRDVGGSAHAVPVDLHTASSPLGGAGGRQDGQVEKGQRRRRWRLVWRAGCVTDVCDVSGLDAVILPSGSHPAFVGNYSSSSSNFHNSHGPRGGDHRQRLGRSTTLEERGTATVSGQGADGGEGEIGDAGGNPRAAVLSPAAIVAVSGQGLQLVVFGAC